MPKSLAQITRELVESKPYYKYVLEQGIANHSALAEKIKADVESELGRKVSLDAIAVSIRRYSEGLVKTATENEKILLKLLAKSKINLKNDIADVTYNHEFSESLLKGVEPLHLIRGVTSTVVILDQDNLQKIDSKKAIEVRENLVELTIITGSEVEKTPGFVHYITELMVENGLNMIEVVSCYTDTILILEEKDALKAYEILRARMK